MGLTLVALLVSACNPTVLSPAPLAPSPLAGLTVVASGLRQPRQMMYTPDGTLWIGEQGTGGDAVITGEMTGAITQTVTAGLSARISKVAPNGQRSVAVTGLPSTATEPGGGDFFGVQGIYVTETDYWVAIGEGPDEKKFAFTLFHNLLQIDRTTLRIKNVVDLWSAAVAHHLPDGEDTNSNPADIAIAADGTLYIADASANALWSWSTTNGLKLVHAWSPKDNPVPTGVAIGPDGDLYVSMLSGFPFAAGSARIERWHGGRLKQTYSGLSMITDVLVTRNGTIYAVQFAEFGEQGPKPASGKVVKVTASGTQDIMTGLITPYGLAQNPVDGSIVVSVLSTGDASGNGAVVKVQE